MITESLQKAIDTLRIHDVYLRSSISQCVNGFDPKYDQDIDKLITQTKHGVKQSHLAKVDENQWLVRVFIEVGIRLVDPEIEQEDESVRAFIEAEFVAEYTVSEDLNQECINEYALKNASYHVWPYWREFLMSQCTRMYLPRLVLPAVQLAHNRHQN
ncbi:preprotein translocase subunit SecB [Crenothrix sp. D3]|nr:preprotein translocase subunit SecB [Crenothrix sp. D3]